eukprot:2406805-Amphidinium_carterae.1
MTNRLYCDLQELFADYEASAFERRLYHETVLDGDSRIEEVPNFSDDIINHFESGDVDILEMNLTSREETTRAFKGMCRNYFRIIEQPADWKQRELKCIPEYYPDPRRKPAFYTCSASVVEFGKELDIACYFPLVKPGGTRSCKIIKVPG